MKIVEQTPGRLVLQEGPWLIWLVGGLFLAAGSAVALASEERVFGAAFAAAGALIILGFANTETVTFDRVTGRFTRTTRGLLRNRTVAHALGEVTGVRVDASRSSNASRTYRVELELTSRRSVPLTAAYSSGKQPKERLAGTIRTFLALGAAPEPPPGFGEMVRALVRPPDDTGQDEPR